MPEYKADKVRAFIKKLPRRRSITERDIYEKFCLKRQTVFYLMQNMRNEFKLSTRLEWQERDNGRKYKVRIYYKP